jgi:hypothetical protein
MTIAGYRAFPHGPLYGGSIPNGEEDVEAATPAGAYRADAPELHTPASGRIPEPGARPGKRRLAEAYRADPSSGPDLLDEAGRRRSGAEDESRNDERRNDGAATAGTHGLILAAGLGSVQASHQNRSGRARGGSRTHTACRPGPFKGPVSRLFHHPGASRA